MPRNTLSWYAVYTKPRWEKKVFLLMSEGGYEAYCPMNRTRKKWSDRMKWVEEPLFKSYIFVRLAEEELTKARMFNGVVNFVYWLGKPAVIKDKEIEIIRKFLNEYKEVQVIRLDLKKDEQIIIQRGAFMNKAARVVKVFNNKVQVIIESLDYALVAVVDKSNLSHIKK
jgi:transcription antitermination factor NusG